MPEEHAASADVIVIAGGKIRTPDLREAAGTGTRALIDLHGKPMLAHVLEALQGCRHVERVCVVGDVNLLTPIAEPLGTAVVAEGTDEVDNLFRGIEALPDAHRALMLACDVPLLTAEAVDDLLARAPKADVVFPICEQSVTLAEYPDREWTFIKTPGGSYTGGCGFLFDPAVISRQRPWLQQVLDSRRNPWQLMRIWGLWFGLRALLHRVTVADAEAHISAVLGLTGRAYYTPYPDLCYDLDYAPHVAQVREHMRKRLAAETCRPLTDSAES